MQRPSKKEIKAAVQKLKDEQPRSSSVEPNVGKLTPKRDNLRIRKQGI